MVRTKPPPTIIAPAQTSVNHRGVSLRAVAATSICLLTLLVAPADALSSDGGKDRDQGISVGQPKVWRYDRIYPLLDGMLQDIESMYLAPTAALNPNAPNLSYVDFLRTLFSVQVDYDQGLGIKNKIAQANSVSAQQQSTIDADYQTLLKRQRNDISSQLIATQADELSDQKAADSAVSGSDAQTLAQKRVDADKSRETVLKAQLQDVGTKITTSGSNGLPAFENADKADSKAQPASFANFLDQLPDQVKTSIFNSSNNASLPASKQMENVVTLLNERLSQELSVIADDASRNGYQLYLFEFNVGLYPPKSSRNKVARVEFIIGDGKCDAAKPAYAYTLTPGTSSYNIQQYIGRSQHFGMIGAFNLLMGLGANGEYQRQRDQFRNGLVQSVYQSGFMNGECSFGWHYGPSPFDEFVTPGNRSSYALIAVRADNSASEGRLPFTVRADWEDRDGKLTSVMATTSPESIRSVRVADARGSASTIARSSLTVERLSYSTLFSSSPNGPTDVTKPAPNTILIVLSRPADPNLVVTANGTVLKRARDTRGEAIHATPDSSGKVVPTPRGEFESADGFGPDTWILADPRTLLLKISQPTAGQDFPLIRIGDSANSSADLTYIVNHSSNVEIQINDQVFIGFGQERHISKVAFAPLFRTRPVKLDQYLSASVEDADEGGRPRSVRVRLHASQASRVVNHEFTDKAQAILEGTGTNVSIHKTSPFALDCVPNSGDLVCVLPSELSARGMAVRDVKSALALSRVYVRDRLRVNVSDNSGAPGKDSLQNVAPQDDLEAEGLAFFDSMDVLPHFNDSFDSVSFKDNKFLITIGGRNISAGDTVGELQTCGSKEVTSKTAAGQMQIAVETAIYHCLGGQLGPFHLLHKTTDAQGTYATVTQSRLRNEQVSIEMPNLRWAVDQGAVGDVDLTSAGVAASGLYNYRLHIQNFHADWINSITLVAGQEKLVVPVTKGGPPDFVEFSIPKSVKTVTSAYRIMLQIDQASIPTFYNQSKEIAFVYDFSKDKCLTCAQ